VAAIHPVSVSSYRKSTRPEGPPVIVGCPPRASIEGRAILVLDTIVDSGSTFEALAREFEALGAAEVFVACLLDKVAARRRPVVPRFRGVEAPDRFLVGYGLDVAGRLRDWPEVVALPTRPSGPVGSLG
jgi:hypoxanthine phosphoribosyltransferase